MDTKESYALSTICSQSIPQTKNSKDVLEESDHILSQIEQTMSRFQEGSFVYQINHSHGQPVQVDANTYYVIEQGLALPEATNKDLYALAEEEQGAYDQLPASLKEATGIAEQSDFLKRVFPKKTLSTLLELQKADVRASEEAINRFAFEMQRYFNRV